MRDETDLGMGIISHTQGNGEGELMQVCLGAGGIASLCISRYQGKTF